MIAARNQRVLSKNQRKSHKAEMSSVNALWVLVWKNWRIKQRKPGVLLVQLLLVFLSVAVICLLRDSLSDSPAAYDAAPSILADGNRAQWIPHSLSDVMPDTLILCADSHPSPLLRRLRGMRMNKLVRIVEMKQRCSDSEIFEQMEESVRLEESRRRMAKQQRKQRKGSQPDWMDELSELFEESFAANHQTIYALIIHHWADEPGLNVSYSLRIPAEDQPDQQEDTGTLASQLQSMSQMIGDGHLSSHKFVGFQRWIDQLITQMHWDKVNPTIDHSPHQRNLLSVEQAGVADPNELSFDRFWQRLQGLPEQKSTGLRREKDAVYGLSPSPVTDPRFTRQCTVDDYYPPSLLIGTKSVSESISNSRAPSILANQQTARMLPFYTLMCFVLLWSNLITDIVDEKQKRLRSLLTIMAQSQGLSETCYILSWLLSYSLALFVVSLLLSALQTRVFGLFVKSSPISLCAVYSLFGVNLLTMAACVARCFANPKTAATVSGFLFFALLSPAYFHRWISLVPWLRLIVALSPQTNLYLSLMEFIRAETHPGHSPFLLFPLISVLSTLLCGVFLFRVPEQSFLEWTDLNSWMKWIRGSIQSKRQRRWKMKYRKLDGNYSDSAEDDSEDELHSDSVTEPVNDSEWMIRLSGVSKTYNSRQSGSVRALSAVSMDLYAGEICGILGPNGAGKTTLVKLITGELEPSEGSVRISHRCRTSRTSIGFCPQTPVLWDELSVCETLSVWHRIKDPSADSRRVAALVEASLREMGLCDKGGSLVKNLSGGQKRKLQILLAFIGEPSIVILDEPGCSLDPISRRQCWDLIHSRFRDARNQRDTLVLLCTHDMSEAEYCDRLALINRGSLWVYGSPFFIKSRSGIGYTLTFHLTGQDPLSQTELTHLVRQHCESAEVIPLQRSHQGSISFRMDLQSSAHFAQLFEHLPQTIDFSLSVTTLDEVFEKLDSDRALSLDDGSAQSGIHSSDESITEFLSSLKSVSSQIRRERQSRQSWMSSLMRSVLRVRALILIRYQSTKRDSRALLSQILTPLISLSITLSLMTSNHFFFGSNPDSTSLSQSVPIELDLCSQLDCPITIAHNPIRSSDRVTHAPFPESNLLKFESLMQSMEQWSERHSHSVLFVETDPSMTSLSQISDFFANQTNEPGESAMSAALHFDHGKGAITVISNHSDSILIPSVMRMIDESIAFSLFEDSTAVSIQAIQHELPKIHFQKNNQNRLMQSMVASTLSLSVVLLTVSSLSGLPTHLAAHVVSERVDKFKHQCFVTGLSWMEYWLGSFLFDAPILLIPSSVILCVVAGFLPFALPWLLPALLGLLLAYALSSILLVYLCCFLFDSAQSAQLILARIFEFSGILMLMAGVSLNQFLPVDSSLRWILTLFRLFPAYSFSESLFNVVLRSNLAGFEQRFRLSILKDRQMNSALDWDLTARNTLHLTLSALTSFVLLCVIESLSFNTTVQRWIHRVKQQSDDELSGPISDGIDVRRLTKEYPSRSGSITAVNRLSFSVGKGQVFGFLGANGAGKSSTIGMLSREIFPSEGTAFLRGCSITDSIRHFFDRVRIGFCPQQGCSLVDHCTIEEHLAFYCRLRGYSESHSRRLIRSLCSVISITDSTFDGRMVSELSGGSKRKLSLGIALLSEPGVMLTDEPTAGIDPPTRLAIWRVIRAVSTQLGTTTLVSTHSIIEAERLCHQIGILRDGSMLCVGSPACLKRRFGRGYELSVKTQSIEQCSVLSNRLIHALQPLSLRVRTLDNRAHQLRLLLETDQPPFPLARVFRILQECERESGSAEYSLSQASLEHVFLQVSQN